MAAPKFVICPSCEGEGFEGILGSYTADEFTEAFEDADEYRALHDVSKVPCSACQGLRVMTAERMAEWADECAYEAERAAERRFGC